MTLDGIAILFVFATAVLSYVLSKRFDKVDEQLEKIDKRLKIIIER